MTETPDPPHVQRLVAFYEALAPADLQRLREFYTAHAYFKDPFNEVRGLSAIREVFEHMFEALHEPRFVVTARVVDGRQCFLAWEFHFRFKRLRPDVAQVIRGGSHLEFAPDGRVQRHRDYWDAAEELYEKLPLVGALMRWLRRRAG